MKKILSRLRSAVDDYNMIQKGDRIAVGVSGGADSLALVLMLKDIGKRVIALTVDHCLRKESFDEAEYVASLMKKYDIPIMVLLYGLMLLFGF